MRAGWWIRWRVREGLGGRQGDLGEEAPSVGVAVDIAMEVDVVAIVEVD